MKIINKSLLATAILTILAGCDDSDYEQKEQNINAAPYYTGNVVVTLDEKDPFKFAYLLGTATGAKTGEGVAKDGEGDFLSVRNLITESTDITGFEVMDNIVGIRPSALIDDLDTGETRTVVYTYDIYDGQNSVKRTATFNIVGEDFAPVVTGPITANYTKDAAASNVNLLLNVTDADNEPLTATDVVADSANPFVIPFTVVDNYLVLDIASIKDQIPDGQKLTFNYDYKVSDHRFTVDHSVMVNILGVKDVPGAPLFAEYFLTAAANETASVQTYDLIQGAVDREGDDILVKNLTLNGSSALEYGITLNGTDLVFSPNAFLSEISAGQTMDFNFLYQVEDSNGNTSDGERSLIVTVTGVQSNVLLQQSKSSSFEGLTDGAIPTGWYAFGWEGQGAPAVTSVDARSGTSSTYLNAGVGMATNWTPQVDKVYYYSSWWRTVANNGFTGTMPVHFNAYGLGNAGRAWWFGGYRPWVADTKVWNESTKIFNTFSGGWPITPEASFQAFSGPLATHSTTGAYVDDITIVDITDIKGYENNMLVSGAGTFEDNVIPANNGEGIVAITDTPTAITTGTYALSVDTTGKSGSSVDVYLPVQAGAVKAGGRYMLKLDILAPAATAANNNFEVKLETVTGEVFNFSSPFWGNGANVGHQVILNTETATGSPDWATEDVKVSLRFVGTDIVYYVDNVTFYAIP